MKCQSITFLHTIIVSQQPFEIHDILGNIFNNLPYNFILRNIAEYVMDLKNDC